MPSRVYLLVVGSDPISTALITSTSPLGLPTPDLLRLAGFGSANSEHPVALISLYGEPVIDAATGTVHWLDAADTLLDSMAEKTQRFHVALHLHQDGITAAILRSPTPLRAVPESDEAMALARRWGLAFDPDLGERLLIGALEPRLVDLDLAAAA